MVCFHDAGTTEACLWSGGGQLQCTQEHNAAHGCRRSLMYVYMDAGREEAYIHKEIHKVKRECTITCHIERTRFVFNSRPLTFYNMQNSKMAPQHHPQLQGPIHMLPANPALSISSLLLSKSMPNMTGRMGCWTTEMNGGSSASYLVHRQLHQINAGDLISVIPRKIAPPCLVPIRKYYAIFYTKIFSGN